MAYAYTENDDVIFEPEIKIDMLTSYAVGRARIIQREVVDEPGDNKESSDRDAPSIQHGFWNLSPIKGFNKAVLYNLLRLTGTSRGRKYTVIITSRLLPINSV